MSTAIQAKPKRIQRRMTKGWKMPPNTVYVGRPTKWGNPFTLAEYGPKLALSNFRNRIEGMMLIGIPILQPLRGKDLACWCPLVDDKGDRVPCHADILLELANK